MLTIALAGDVMLGRGVNQALSYMKPEEPWGDTLGLLAAADIRIINLECALSSHRRPWSRSYKVFHFRADPEAVRVLQAARIDLCSLANNHTLDFEEQGLLDTIHHLDAAGIRHAGAGRDLKEAAQPAIVEAGQGVLSKVALVAFTDNEPEFAAGSARPGTNYLPVALDSGTLSRAGAAIAAAREKGADVVVFSNHWGPNMVQRPPKEFREFARAVLDLGADIYYGQSAHVFQGIEIYRGRPILYDTGDFIDDYAVDPQMRNDWSFLFRITLNDRSLKLIELFPVMLGYARVDLARDERWEMIAARMERLCAEMGTVLVRGKDRLIYESPRQESA